MAITYLADLQRVPLDSKDWVHCAAFDSLVNSVLTIIRASKIILVITTEAVQALVISVLEHSNSL